MKKKAQRNEHSAVDSKLEDLYELVLDYCNLEPIKTLLREHKQDEGLPEVLRDDIRISGKNARSIVTENLKNAVTNGAIPESAVFHLLQEAEENGNQHIFFFRARNKASRATLANADAIRKALLGQNSQASATIPSLTLLPMGFTWSDFRDYGKTGWIAKLYGHATKEEEADEKKDASERSRWVKFVQKDIRQVFLVRWRNQPGILELRVPAGNAKRGLDELKHELSQAVDVDTLCVPWELNSVRRVVFQQRDAVGNADLYECSNWQAIDAESYVLQGGPHSQNPDQQVQAASATRQLIEAVAASDEHEKQKLVIHWKPTESNGLKKSLRTILGTVANTHEMIVTAQASSRALDDVVDQLLRFEQ